MGGLARRYAVWIGRQNATLHERIAGNRSRDFNFSRGSWEIGLEAQKDIIDRRRIAGPYKATSGGRSGVVILVGVVDFDLDVEAVGFPFPSLSASVSAA